MSAADYYTFARFISKMKPIGLNVNLGTGCPGGRYYPLLLFTLWCRRISYLFFFFLLVEFMHFN